MGPAPQQSKDEPNEPLAEPRSAWDDLTALGSQALGCKGATVTRLRRCDACGVAMGGAADHCPICAAPYAPATLETAAPSTPATSAVPAAADAPAVLEAAAPVAAPTQAASVQANPFETAPHHDPSPPSDLSVRPATTNRTLFVADPVDAVMNPPAATPQPPRATAPSNPDPAFSHPEPAQSGVAAVAVVATPPSHTEPAPVTSPPADVAVPPAAVAPHPSPSPTPRVVPAAAAASLPHRPDPYAQIGNPLHDTWASQPDPVAATKDLTVRRNRTGSPWFARSLKLVVIVALAGGAWIAREPIGDAASAAWDRINEIAGDDPPADAAPADGLDSSTHATADSPLGTVQG